MVDKLKQIAQMRLDFIGIGVQKSATSWLFECLLAHPDIRGAVIENYKELNFFNHNYHRGYPWYQRLFEFGPWKTGEYSVLYFWDAGVPERIYRYNPDVKLILSLRNPIDRAFSQHKHVVRAARTPEAIYDFWDAVELNPTYVEQGKYATLMERYLKFFDLKQIHIILYDDITSKPSEVLRGLYSFLGVDETFTPPSLETRINVGRAFKSRKMDKLIMRSSTFVRQRLGRTVHSKLKATRLPALVRRYNVMEFDEHLLAPLSEDDRKRMYEMFAGEIKRLESLIGKDLSHWR